MRIVQLMLALSLLAMLTACPEPQPPGPAQGGPTTAPRETLLYRTAAERPAWTMEEPDAKDGMMWFVGLSGKLATEQLSREDARASASSSVVKYMGTFVKDKLEKARVSYGLSSDVVDPTTASREFEKQMSVNMARNMKVKSWYAEQWQSPTGTYWLTFCLASIPVAVVEDPYKQTAQAMAQDAERKAKEANDEIARKQAEKAAEFWKQMQDQGVTEQ